MKTSDFYYDLPEALIAQDPLEKRSDSRLLQLNRKTGEITHGKFQDILNVLAPGDCLVLNDTKVIPARLIGVREDTGAKIEILLLNRREHSTWEILVKPGKKAQIGAKINFGDGLLIGEIVDIVEEGNRLISFTYEGIFEEVLNQLGEMPLPPYITHQLADKSRYNTVYASNEGSAAAPTAGLHFTKELLQQLEEKGVEIATITLHVGLGTFRPVKVEDVTKHHMHAEVYAVDQMAADKINQAKEKGKRVICIGTTSCRTLEAVAADHGKVVPCTGSTEIFIYPGFPFRVMDGLLTNFHLPESTLIMLVAAFSSREIILHAYEEAVKEKYRFFSFGDAMLLL